MRIEAENLVRKIPWRVGVLLDPHGGYQQSSKILRSTYTSNVHEYYFIDFQLHQHEYDYFNYSSRLVSTSKPVEDGSRGINN
jgi:hypothetical protein